MKTDSPQRHKGTEKCKSVRGHGIRACPILIVSVSLCLCGSGFAAGTDPGRLFYTPAERAQLENARARGPSSKTNGFPGAADAVRYDGLVVRADGQRIRWVNGKAQLDTAGVEGLKPGQIRAGKRVFEPYQVLTPAPQAAEEETP
jgi:hypothetical protein